MPSSASESLGLRGVGGDDGDPELLGAVLWRPGVRGLVVEGLQLAADLLDLGAAMLARAVQFLLAGDIDQLARGRRLRTP